MLRMLAALLASTALLGAAAKANTITQSYTYGPQLTDFSLPNTFNLFDSNLGTLTDIVFSDSYGFTSAITLTSSGSPSSGSVKSESLLGLTSDAANINSILANELDTNGASGGNVASAAFDLLGKSSTYSNFTGTKQINSNATTVSSGPVTDSTASDLVPFEAAGGGTFVVTTMTYTTTDLSNTGGNTSASQNTNATATVSIAYDYTPPATVTPPSTPVPEPASLAVIGASLLATGLFRKQRG